MIDGIIPIYKEKGFTSFDVCAKVRGIIHQKKVGHTGTLDPMAEGVLPVCVGSSTKLSDYIAGSKKEYIAEFIIGLSTDTLDVTGTVDNVDDKTLSNQSEIYDLMDSGRIDCACKEFIGDIEQIPPMYSAIRQNGKHLYELAREGKVVERKPREITIYDIELLDKMQVDLYDVNNISESVKAVGDVKLVKCKIRVECSKGTYIRTLIDDIGHKLGSYACMSELTRTYTGNIDIKETVTLSELEDIIKSNGNIDSILIRPDVPFMDMRSIVIKDEFSKLLYNGNKLSEYMIETSEFDSFDEIDNARVYDHNKSFIGIYERVGDVLKIKVFLYDGSKV